MYTHRVQQVGYTRGTLAQCETSKAPLLRLLCYRLRPAVALLNIIGVIQSVNSSFHQQRSIHVRRHCILIRDESMGSIGAATSQPEYDVLIIGCGLSGIYTLYRMQQLGLKVKALEAGAGEGGTWFWSASTM